MKAELQAVVVRKNGVAIACEGINDCYTPVLIYIRKDYFTEEEIDSLPKKYFLNINDNTISFSESEAIDICGTYGCITVDIEKFEVNI